MEPLLIKDYINIVKKHYKIFVFVIVLSLIVAALLTYFLPKSFTSNVEMYVRHKGSDAHSLYYTYDGYYSTQASVQYTETVAGFLQSYSSLVNTASKVEKDPDYIKGGFLPKELSTNTDYLVDFRKHISVKIAAPQLIVISVNDPDSAVSELWAKYLGDTVTNSVGELNIKGDSNFVISTIHDPVTQTNKLSIVIDEIIALIIGLFISFTIGFIIEAYNKK